MNKEIITVDLVSLDDGFAYDVRLHDEKATLKQYIESLDAFLDRKIAPCLGCDNCCYQRIPLTLPDLYDYAGKEKAQAAAFLAERAVIEKSGPAIDIHLARTSGEACTFLDTEEQRCKDHLHRSLVCHTYICIPQTDSSRELREYLINQGEDALIAQLFQWDLLKEYEGLRESYPINESWQGKDYDEILLKDVLSPELWDTLTKPL